MGIKTYRQIAHKLRFHDVNGKEKSSERPREGNRKSGFGKYLDSDKNPTLITIADTDVVNVEMLVKNGGLVEYNPPKAKPAAKAVNDGEIL